MRVFIISLKGHERRKKISESMQNLGIDFEYFDAVDGEKLTDEQKSLIDYQQALINKPRGMCNGEFGCAISHALLYQKIVTEKINDALILEDDVIPNKEFKEMLNANVFERSNFDLIMLCHAKAWCIRWSFRLFYGEYETFRVWNTPYVTAGYYINIKAARNLYKVAIPISTTADWPVGAFHGLSTGCLRPQVLDLPERLPGQSMLDVEREKMSISYKLKKKKRGFLSKCRKKLFVGFFIPKRKNTRLPLIWLKLLGYRLPDK